MFQKMVENKIARGGGLLGNWNLNEHVCALPYAIAMDDDADMPGGKGRRYYLDQLLNRTMPGNGAYKDVIAANLSRMPGFGRKPPRATGKAPCRCSCSSDGCTTGRESVCSTNSPC